MMAQNLILFLSGVSEAANKMPFMPAHRPRELQSNVCSLPMEVGRCKAAFPKFYFNESTRACESFRYGGCGGNGNNFDTLEECDQTCGSCKCNKMYRPVCKVVSDSNGYFLSATNYNNECLAKCSGMTNAEIKEGKCTGCEDPWGCGDEQTCVAGECYDQPLPTTVGPTDDCACTKEYNPVCGDNGITYSNRCMARCAQTDVAYAGECDDCACTKEYNPVCGDNGITYSNRCMARCAQTDVAYAGECATGCCSSIGYGAMMVPCCLSTQAVRDETECRNPPGFVGGAKLFSQTCPTSAQQASDWMKARNQDENSQIISTPDESEGGHGGPCVFPFIFDSTTFHTCARDGDWSWCSTKTNNNDVHVSGEGNWGWCPAGTVAPTFTDNLLGGSNGKGKKCVFPFRFGGKNYYHCAHPLSTDTVKRVWCSTLTDVNGNHVGDQGNWGYCKL